MPETRLTAPCPDSCQHFMTVPSSALPDQDHHPEQYQEDSEVATP